MMDKPKSLYEQLTELAGWIEDLPNHDIEHLLRTFHPKVAEVRAMAERVKGKVIAPVDMSPPLPVDQRWQGKPRFEVAYGETQEEMVANLQSLLDQQKG